MRRGRPGDIHVTLTGLPQTFSIAGSVLTDAVRGTWIERMSKSVLIPDEPSALPLAVKRRADGVSADVFFPPYRDDSGETMTLRLITMNGKDLLVRFAGGNCDLSLRFPKPAASRTLARPGDDLQALVEEYRNGRARGWHFSPAPAALAQASRESHDGRRLRARPSFSTKMPRNLRGPPAIKVSVRQYQP